MCFNRFFHIAGIAIIIVTAAVSCGNPGAGNKTATDTVVATKPVAADSAISENNGPDTTDNVTLYFTVADTGLNYFTLRDEMFALNKTLHWPIDTMGRYFDKKKNLISVSDTDEDEMYRGEYFPRRFPSENLSLEYYHAYIDNSTEKNIALVTGIYETKKSADSSLAILRPYAAHSFVVAANVYVGCMH